VHPPLYTFATVLIATGLAAAVLPLLPGLLLGPFVGAVLGELSAGRGVQRSTRVGVSAWVGLMFGAAWWWNRAV
jgi:uncharacterized protein YqgC (DUF456 family)